MLALRSLARRIEAATVGKIAFSDRIWWPAPWGDAWEILVFAADDPRPRCRGRNTLPTRGGAAASATPAAAAVPATGTAAAVSEAAAARSEPTAADGQADR